MNRLRIISAALVGGMVLAGAPRVHAGAPASTGQGRSQGLTAAQRQQIQFVRLLLLKQSTDVRNEIKTIKDQDRAIVKLNQLEGRLINNPKQEAKLDSLIQQTVIQINADQTQIDQAKTLLTLDQSAVDRATQALDLLLKDNRSAAGILRQLDRRAAQLRQSTQLILNRPPATASFPG
jgi:hypothetical protein